MHPELTQETRFTTVNSAETGEASSLANPVWRIYSRTELLIGARRILKPSLRYDYPLIPPNRASRPIRDEER